MGRIINSPDIVTPRMYKAAEIIASKFNVSEETVLATMTEHLLIYTAELKNDKNGVTFNMLSGQKSVGDDIPLNSQDGFVISSWGRAVRRVTLATTGEYTSNAPYFATPEPQYFNGLVGGVKEYESLIPYFFGQMELKEKNGDPIISEYSGLLTFKQLLGSYTPSAAGPINEEYAETDMDRTLRNQYPMQMLLGSQNYTATVNFSNGIYSQCAGKIAPDGTTVRGTQNFAVLFLRGFKVPGLASAKLIADK